MSYKLRRDRSSNVKMLGASILTILMILTSISSIVIYVAPVSADDPNPTTNIWTTDEFGNLKDDFAPGDIVYINGEGFSPNEQITELYITRPDGETESAPGNRFPDYLPTIDENGNFDFYEYDLNGIFGTYLIYASDGINFAEASFTDGPYTVESYSDNSYSTIKNFYNTGETVYAKGDLTSGSYYLRLKFLDPDGNNMHECITTTKTNTINCNYVLASGAPVGEWDINMYRAYSIGGPWLKKDEDHFYVGIDFEENPELPYSCGIDMVLILDSSDSISTSDLTKMQNAFKDFVDLFLPLTPTEIAVVDFDTTATILQGYTSDVGLIKAAIDSTSKGGYTNWDDALVKAHSLYPNRADKPTLYIFSSDGNPNRWGPTGPSPNNYKQAIIEAIGEANTVKNDDVRIITLGIGDTDLDEPRLQAISSPDAYYDVNSFDELETKLFEIASELCGGTIFIKKYVDGENASNWEFTAEVTGGEAVPPSGYTDDNGSLTFTIQIDDGTAEVDIIETIQNGYMIESISAIDCFGNPVVGTIGEDGIYGLTVGKTCFTYIVFNNTEIPPPETTKEYGTPICIEGDKDYITSDTPIYLNGTSPLSCYTIKYRIWFNDEWSEWVYGDPETDVVFTLNELVSEIGGNWNDECMHKIEYHAFCGEQIEEVKNQTFYVDNSGPPAVDKEIGQPKYGPNDKFVGLSSTIWLNASDPEAGCSDAPVETIRYIITWDSDNDGVVDDEVANEAIHGNKTSFHFEEACMHELEFWSIDCLGNEGEHTVQTHYVDDECPPEGEWEFIGPHYIKDDIDYITNETIKRITVVDLGCDVGEGTDEAAGVEILEWQVKDKDKILLSENSTIDNKNCYYEDAHVIVTGDNSPLDGIVSIDITIKEDCKHFIYHRGVDYLGNKCEWVEQEVRVDTQPPVVQVEVGQPSCNVGGDYCISNHTRIWINATDDMSNYPCNVSSVNLTIGMWYDGVWYYETPYHINEGKLSVDFTFEEKGLGSDCTHYLTYWAEDNLGNRIAEENITFNVSSKLPQIFMEVGDPNCTDCGGMGEFDFCVNKSTPIYITVIAPEGSKCTCPGLTVEWSYDNSNWYPLEDPIFYFSDTDCGERTLYVRAYDCRGEMVYAEGHFYVDEIPPPIAPGIDENVKEVGEPKVRLPDSTEGNEQWLIYPGTPISFNLSNISDDTECCPCPEAYIEYRIWYYGTWSDWEQYTGEDIYLTEGCVHYLEARAYDCIGNRGEIDNETFWVCSPGGGGEFAPKIEFISPTFGSTYCEKTLDVILDASDGETPTDKLTVVLWIPGGRRDAPSLWYYPEYDSSDGLFHADIDIYNYQNGANLTLMALVIDGDNNIANAVPTAFTVCSTTAWDQWMQYGWNPLPLSGGMPPEFECNETLERMLSSIDGNYDWVFYYTGDSSEPWISYYTGRPDNELETIEGGKNYWVHITNKDGIRYYIAKPEVEIQYPEDGSVFTDEYPDEISGYAWDSEGGISKVELLLFYEEEGTVYYWDGSDWTTTFTYLPCELDSYPENYKQDWYYDSSGVLWINGMTYNVFAIAYDTFDCYQITNITFSINLLYTISGTVTYSGEYSSDPGPVYVELIDTFINLKAFDYIALGPYSFPAPNGNFYVVAFMDINGNGDYDVETEPAGAYGGDPPTEVVVSGADRTGIDINLIDFETPT